MSRYLAVALPLLLTACGASAQPVSGQYGPLLISVADGRISAVFVDAVGGSGPGGAPQFLCATLLDGQAAGDSAALRAWLPDDPERISGELHAGGETIVLRLDENPPGCAMASSLTGEGQRLLRTSAHPDWIGAGLVTAERAVLHPEPQATSGRRTPYLVAWNAVAIIAERGAWVQVEYVGGKQPVRGWLRRSDLAVAG
ncbi:hypothetical protein PK98_02090 [Croceibacterium mercuriale]|uniref:SH3b domain-containing protein n=1 Tax=Croceibacterium mercuriale TaxID=1572751 RepID=A0A0B2BZP6_9SPHN|nr:hypothetical protein [Croceibacterium mercuriale]KHL25502.1 hypothetical protein PK98_02090 [Croceibacterium mercuriale]